MKRSYPDFFIFVPLFSFYGNLCSTSLHKMTEKSIGRVECTKTLKTGLAIATAMMIGLKQSWKSQNLIECARVGRLRLTVVDVDASCWIIPTFNSLPLSLYTWWHTTHSLSFSFLGLSHLLRFRFMYLVTLNKTIQIKQLYHIKFIKI